MEGLKIYVFSLMLGGMFFCLPAGADCSPDYCSDVYVDKLYVQSDGTIYVGTSGDEAVLNCGAVSGVYVTLPSGAPGASKVYSALLAAQTAGKKIEAIQVEDYTAGCIIQYVTLVRQ